MPFDSRWLLLTGALALGAVGCDDDADQADKPCDVETHDGCADGLVCEPVDGAPTCIGPVEVRGQVFALETGDGIAGATVVALDANGAARTTTVRTDDDGRYALTVPAQRDADGRPLDPAVTLRVDAAGFVHFPRPPRIAVPVVLSEATQSADEDDPAWVVTGPTTAVGLVDLPVIDGRTVTGTVSASDPGGVLVTATAGARAAATAVTDADGRFVLFDVPKGDVTIAGWRRGLNIAPETVGGEADVDEVTLEAGLEGLVTVRGAVNIVNAPGGATTTVILVPEVTFDPDRIAGEAPAGLRAVDVAGSFEIDQVPPGDYAVLAAFENDALVRDPDEGIGGTAVVHATVAADPTDLGSGFKVTGALAVVSPGADGVETVDSQTPRLRWADDSSEDGYDLYVHDALGELVYLREGLDRVTGADTVEHTVEEPLARGTLYQFRVASYRDRQAGRTYISATEDLKGVFLVPAAAPDDAGETR